MKGETKETLEPEKKQEKLPLPQVPVGPRFEFPLGEGNVFRFSVESHVSRKDYDRMKKLFELAEESLVDEDVS